MALGFLVGGYLTWHWAPKHEVPREKIEVLLVWIVIGTILGARIYFVVQNDFGSYVREPWHILAVWEGGLAFFGGLLVARLPRTCTAGATAWHFQG
jgi:phosphatidylglycerol:prolipoprotein diacylglycerol transferase